MGRRAKIKQARQDRQAQERLDSLKGNLFPEMRESKRCEHGVKKNAVCVWCNPQEVV